MPVNIIDTLKPKNGLSFPVVEAIDVFVENYGNLADAISHFATDAMIAAINAALSGKANTSDVNTATASLQAQIDQIAQTAGTGTADTEIGQARVGADGTNYNTLKTRLDAENYSLTKDLNDFIEFNDNISDLSYTATTTAQNNYFFATVTNIKADKLYNVTGFDNLVFAVRENDAYGAYLKTMSDDKWYTSSNYNQVFFEIRKADSSALTEEEKRNVKIYEYKRYYEDEVEQIPIIATRLGSVENTLYTTVEYTDYNAYIDARDHQIVADSDSKLFYALTTEGASGYHIDISGNNNRARVLLFYSVPNSVVGAIGTYVDFGNSTKSITLNKSQYGDFKAFAICTNYSTDSFATIAINPILKDTLLDTQDKVFVMQEEVAGIEKGLSENYSGDLIVVEDSLRGNANITNVATLQNATIKSIGRNLFNYNTAEFGTISGSTGEDDNSFLGAVRSEEFIPVVGDTEYSVISVQPIKWYRIATYDENKDFIERIEKFIDGTFGTMTIPSTAKYVRLTCSVSSSAQQPSYSIESCKIMFYKGSELTTFSDYESSTISVISGETSGILNSYNDCTTIHAEYGMDLSVDVPVNIAKIIKKYLPDDSSEYTDTECRTRFRLEMQELADRLGMSNTVIGDGGGYPLPTQITAIDAIRMLSHAMGFKEISDTWTYDSMMLRTKGNERTITLNSTLFTDQYIADLTDYYTVLGFKTGAGSTHNLVCACTNPELNGKVLVGCICLNQVADTSDINRPKAMKVLMDLGLAKLNDRSADVTSYVTALTNMTALHFAVCLMPDSNNPLLLNRWDFNNNYSLLYKSDDMQFSSFSMVKLMCAMTALTFANDLEKTDTIIDSDLLIGTGAYGLIFQGGEVITIRQALDALLIHSSNQAAYFLERVIGKKILQSYGSDGFLQADNNEGE